jgi:hypothetical protein
MSAGLNTGTPKNVTDVLQKAIAAQRARIAAGEVIVTRSEPMAAAGGHSEVNALNAAVREQEKLLGRKLVETELRRFELHNVWLRGENPGTAVAPRCEHCARITRSVSVTQSMFHAEGGVSGEIVVRRVAPGAAGGTAPNSSTPAPPKSGSAPPRLTTAKAFKAGIKGAFSAPAIAAAIPMSVLQIADKFAARDAKRKIITKFIKEGFAKGFAACLQGWTRTEMESGLMNRVNVIRIRELGDAAGSLSQTYILQLAEAYENYAVRVGYEYVYAKSLEWKSEMRDKAFLAFVHRGYAMPSTDDGLFEFEHIRKLAFVIHHTTDAIVGPAIQFN